MFPRLLVLSTMLFAFFFLSVPSGEAQTTAFTYQGSLTDGMTPASGAYQMQFSLFDLATGGTQSGATITNNSVTVASGVFTVQLDFSPATPFAAGAPRWLQIAVRKASDPPGFTPLSPRQQITSSPYSIRTISAAASDSLSAACVGCVVDSQIGAVSGAKVTGTVANATNATTAASVSGIVGPGNGGTGLSLSGGAGNFLRSNGTFWQSLPIQSGDIPTGSANYIQNLATGSTAQAAANFHIAGSGRVDSRFFVNDAGQTGDTVSISSTAANPYAINGYSGNNGAGVYARINAGNSTNVPAILGDYQGSSLTSVGLRGLNQTTGATGESIGVEGDNVGRTGAGVAVGVRGFSSPAVQGNQRIGVLGEYDGNQFGLAVVGIGFGGTLPTGDQDIAVVGWRANNSNYSGYFNGNHVIANGTKSASVPTSMGNQLLYAMESPEVWFEDIGSGKLVNGTAEIKLDPLFLETVVIDVQHPMHVFIQMEDESEEVFVKKGSTSFVVKERNGGTSNAGFSYRIIAKRYNFQDHRFGSDPVWGPGDTRKFSQYAPPPPIDYETNRQFQLEQKRNWKPTPLPEGFKYIQGPLGGQPPARTVGPAPAAPQNP